MMKKIWLTIVGSALLLSVVAQAADGWSEEFDKTMKQAKEQGKHVLVDFSGSDWCGWCIRLHNEVFSQEAFTAYAKENLLLVSLDFPSKKKQSDKLKKQNTALAEKYEIRGYPTVLIFNAQGEVIEKTGYRKGGAEAYVAHIKSVLAKTE